MRRTRSTPRVSTPTCCWRYRHCCCDLQSVLSSQLIRGAETSSRATQPHIRKARTTSASAPLLRRRLQKAEKGELADLLHEALGEREEDGTRLAATRLLGTPATRGAGEDDSAAGDEKRFEKAIVQAEAHNTRRALAVLAASHAGESMRRSAPRGAAAGDLPQQLADHERAALANHATRSQGRARKIGSTWHESTGALRQSHQLAGCHGNACGRSAGGSGLDEHHPGGTPTRLGAEVAEHHHGSRTKIRTDRRMAATRRPDRAQKSQTCDTRRNVDETCR